jgi:hypothetical protein
MPRSFSPRLISSGAAKSRADLSLAKQDLEHVAACCTEILERGQHPMMDTTSRALLDSAVVRYGRCFNRGKRTRLDKVVKQLADEHVRMHEFVMSLRDKHIAHSVNEFEMAGSQIYVAVLENGELVRGGLGIGGSSTLGLSMDDVESFEALARMVSDRVKDWAKRLDVVVAEEIGAMTDDQILALPEGFPPIERAQDVKATRTWPPKRAAKF